MLKKYYTQILLFLATLLVAPLYATQYYQQDESKNDLLQTASNPKLLGYYDYTLKHSKRKIDNSVDPEELEEEQQDLKENHVAEKLKNKKEPVFFMLIASNKQTKELSKFFFINANPNTAKEAIRKAERLYNCHVISHTTPRLSPHIVFQVLGWLDQEQNKYVPVFIHAKAPICVTCDAIISNFFSLHMLSNAKGCNGSNSLNLETKCPLAQQYIKRQLTLPLAKKILLPSLRLTYENKSKLLASSNEKQQIEKLLLENETLQKEKSSFQGRYKRIENEKNDLKNRCDNLSIEKESLQNRYNKLQKRYNNLDTKSKKQVELFKKRIELPYSPLKGHTSAIWLLAISYDNRYIVSGSSDKTIRIWDFKTGAELSYSPLKGHTNTVLSVDITKDNKYIVSGSSDKTIRIWDLKTGKELGYSPLRGHICAVRSVTVTKDNAYIVSGSGNGSIRIWDLKTGKEVHYSPLKSHSNSVYSIAVTNNNKYIVSGGWDHTIRIWDLKTGKEVNYSPLRGHQYEVYSVSITTNNQFIVSGDGDFRKRDDNTIRIWNFNTGKEVNYSPLKGHTDKVNSIAVTSDNQYIVSGDQGGAIRIWNFNTGKELRYSPLKGHNQLVFSVALSNDNAYIVSGSFDETIRIWDLKLLSYLQNDEYKEDEEVFDID